MNYFFRIIIPKVFDIMLVIALILLFMANIYKLNKN